MRKRIINTGQQRLFKTNPTMFWQVAIQEFHLVLYFKQEINKYFFLYKKGILLFYFETGN